MSIREVENPMVNDRYWGWNSLATFKELSHEEVEYVTKCCMCLSEVDGEIASEIFEDTYLCESKECHDLHYKNWAESLELQKYFIKEKKRSSGNEHFLMGI